MGQVQVLGPEYGHLDRLASCLLAHLTVRLLAAVSDVPGVPRQEQLHLHLPTRLVSISSSQMALQCCR